VNIFYASKYATAVLQGKSIKKVFVRNVFKMHQTPSVPGGFYPVMPTLWFSCEFRLLFFVEFQFFFWRLAGCLFQLKFACFWACFYWNLLVFI